MSANTVIGHHVSIGAGSVLRSVTVENEVVIGVKCVPTRAPAPRTHAAPPGARTPAPPARPRARADASPRPLRARPAGRCVLMEGVVVESGAVLADGTVVPPARRIPGKQLWAGNPAHYVRDLTYDELHEISHLAETLSEQAAAHGDQLLCVPSLRLSLARLHVLT